MATLIFLPNDHLLAWVYRAPGWSTQAVLRAVARGEWPFPPAWRVTLEDQYIVPTILILRALPHGDLVIVRTEYPLQERLAGRYVPLNPGQAQVLGLMAQGLTTGQIAGVMHVRRRWIKYRVAEVKRRLGAATRAQAVERRGRA